MKEKDRFEMALEWQIDSYVETMQFEEGPNPLLSPELQRKKIKTEKATAEMKELSEFLEHALKAMLR